MTKEEIMGLTNRELEIVVGREVMGYSVCCYGKEKNCFLLWDSECNPVSPPVISDGVLDQGQRSTEAAAWNTTPAYTTDANALFGVLEEISWQGLSEAYERTLRQTERPSTPCDSASWTYSSLKYTTVECLRAALLTVTAVAK